MSKQEFLDNFRIARSLFAHPRVETDSPDLDPQALENMIARAAIWLTPKSVHGFDVDDFAELGQDKQRALQAAVHEFLNVAKNVPPKDPATPEQLEQAKNAFLIIQKMLMPYLPVPREGEKVEEALRSIIFPSWVVNWEYELGSDEEEAPAVWINIYIDDGESPRTELGRFSLNITKQIRETLTAVGIQRWPYVRIRTAIEHKTAQWG